MPNPTPTIGVIDVSAGLLSKRDASTIQVVYVATVVEGRSLEIIVKNSLFGSCVILPA
jgi:hypothetical protein